MITPQTFSQVTIDPGSSTNDYTRAYQVFVSNDAVTWNAPVASGTGSSGVLTIMFPSQTARFIGIVQTGSGTNWWSISEINVYGPGSAPTVLLSPTGWIASASATGGSDVPGRAIDGQTSTRWSTGTSQTNGQWFQLDMLQPQTLAKIVMNSDGSASDYARGFQVFVGNSTSSFGPAVATGSATSSPITVTFPAATGRYLRIVQTGSASNWWSIAELSVYGVNTFSPVATVLPRTGWTATASSSCGTDTPDKALDDNGSTRWSSGLNQASGQFFRVDMQAPRSFTKLTLDAGASNGDYPRGYAVYVSQDGTSWGNAVATGNGSGQLLTITFPYQNARYVKIALTSSASSNWWSIHEFNVYGVAPFFLIRDNWVASASANGANAGAAIDGKLSTRWSTQASQSNGQSFQVDMRGLQTFDEITLDADGASSDFPRAFQVFVSNDGVSWGSSIASGTGSSSQVLVSFASQHARYLKLVQTGSSSNWWSIAELNVLSSVLSIQPAVQCVVQHDSTHYTAVFKYTNNGADGWYVPVGSSNSFGGLNANQGQSTTFAAGTNENSAFVDFDGTGVTWQLLGASATATAQSPACVMKCIGDVPLGAAFFSGEPVDGDRTFSQASHFKIPTQFNQIGGSANVNDRLELAYEDSAGKHTCVYGSNGGGSFAFTGCPGVSGVGAGSVVTATAIGAHLNLIAPGPDTVAYATVQNVDDSTTCPRWGTPFSLSIDNDGDGVSDQLSHAIDLADTSGHDLGDTINILARLPMGGAARALGAKEADLMAAMLQAQDQAGVDSAGDQIQVVRAAMLNDPGSAIFLQQLVTKVSAKNCKVTPEGSPHS